jgi:signal transduction histidine kinase
LDAALAAVLLLGAGLTVSTGPPQQGPVKPGVTVSPDAPVQTPGAGQGERPSDEPSHPLALVILAPFLTIPLAFRRRWPLQVLAIVALASATSISIGGTGVAPFVLVIALYSVAAHTDRRTATRAGLATLAVIVLPLVLGQHVGPVEAVFELGFLVLGWMFGAYLGELRGRAARVRREQENEMRRAIAEEQARIARELHDVMAHSVSVMVVQAAAAEDVFDASPDRAREALRSIESTGRDALAEVRRVLDVVRPGDGQAPELAPQPGLASLDELIGRVRATGLRVVLRIEGDPTEIPAGIDLSAYRIVQEALTNTLKHGRGVSKATVVIRFESKEVAVDVCDDGAGGPPWSTEGEGATGR